MERQTRREFLKQMGIAAASVGTLSVLPSCASVGQTRKAGKKQPNIFSGQISNTLNIFWISILDNQHITSIFHKREMLLHIPVTNQLIEHMRWADKNMGYNR